MKRGAHMPQKTSLFLIAASLTAIAGCQTTGTTAAVPMKTGVSSVGDASDRSRLQNDVVLGDFIAIAETVTNRMLGSNAVAEWGDSRPIIIVGDVINNTSDESIRVSGIQNRVQEVVIASRLARVVQNPVATNFDYITTSELSSSTQYNGFGQAISTYVFTMKLLDKEGFIVDQWTEDLRIETAG